MEGIDGAGKSTHIERLATLFRKQGRTVVVSREPGGTPLAEKIRSVLLADRMDSLSEALLMFAARREHIVEVIAPALRRGDVVISDRYTDSSFAYQGGGRQFDTSKLETLESWVQDADPHAQAVVPDLTLWFDLPAEIAAARLSTARAPDKFESESVAFFARVIAAYQRRQDQCPSRITRIDAHRSVDDVWHQVLGAIQQRGWNTP